MPKHGWKWRTEQVRKLSAESLGLRLAGLEGHCSARLARWIYKNLIPVRDIHGLAPAALNCIRFDDDAPWADAFLLGELELHKADPLGDWIVIALTRSNDHMARFLELYEDESAHPMTRGSAVFGINSSLGPRIWSEGGWCRPPMPEELAARVRDVCAQACIDQNPYARAGAAWLAHSLGDFEAEIAVLAQDQTIVPDHGHTVASYAEDLLEFDQILKYPARQRRKRR